MKGQPDGAAAAGAVFGKEERDTPTTNTQGKTRNVNDPYEIWLAPGWEWRVLKKYQAPEREATNAYARWFLAVKTTAHDHWGGGYDLGDTYVHDVTAYGQRLPDEDLAAHLAANKW